MSKPVDKSYGDCEGPLGLPMRSDVAKDVERIIGELPADCKELIASGPMRVMKLAAGMEFSDAEMADISFITTESVDRDGEVMLAAGGDFSQWKRNPIVTWAHQYDSLPVGRGLWIKRDESNGRKGWLAKTGYIGRPANWKGDWFNDAVWHYVRTNNLPGKSIGFIPLEVRPPDEKEIRQRPELAKVRRVIPKWLALEYAVAPVPCNPDTLVQATAKARAKGIAVPDSLLADVGLIIPDEMPRLDFADGRGPGKASEEPAREPAVVLTASRIAEQVRKSISQEVARIDLASLVREVINGVKGRV